VAKNYRTIKFITLTETLEIDVRTSDESVSRNELSSEFEAASGKRYKQVTGENTNYSYTFDLCNTEVFDFFNSAFAADSLTFERELDDGTFDSFGVFLRKPQYQDESVGENGDKVYRNLTVEVLTA
jgi:hypothetical protein